MFVGSLGSPTLGLGIEARAGPPAFAVLIMLIVNAYKRMGHGAKLMSAYTARLFLLAAVMYVDDIDLLQREKSLTAYNKELIEQVQDTTMDCTILGQATD